MADFTVWLFDNEMRSLGELSVSGGSLLSCVMSLEINGEHSLSIETDRQLSVGTRALTQDPSGRWREWVVDEVEQEHSNTEYGTCSYHLVWSLQYDLQGTNEGTILQPGMDSVTGCSSGVALISAVKGSMWVPDITQPNTKTAVVMNYNSAWDRLDQVVKHWGGEIDDRIEVDDNGVTKRYVRLVNHVGDTNPTRRLEWRHDLTSISRSPDPGPYFCRVIPTGNGESFEADDGETSISEPLTISRLVGRRYLADNEAEMVFRVKDGDGYFYPQTVVNYSTDDDAELLTLAYEDLHNHTRPNVSYSGTVSQLAEAGMDIGDGVNLGDEVQIVDYGFNKDYPLKTFERVVKIEWDMLRLEDKKVTIGKFRQTLEKTMAGMASAVGLEKIAALEDLDWANVEVPQYEAMTIETPDGEFTIDPVEYEPLDLSEYMGRIETLESVVSALTGVTYDPETDTYYDRYGDVITPGIETSIADADAYVPTTTYDDVGVSLASGDGWEHQIDGKAVKKAVVNFVTVRNASSDGNDGGDSGKSDGIRKELKEAQAEHQALLRLAAQDRKNKSKTENKKKKSTNFKVTAANIQGYVGVNTNTTSYTELWGIDNSNRQEDGSYKQPDGTYFRFAF